MTIYSQHPNRGKVQILATYRSSAGITSSTVTSLTESTLATSIVDALNRISALATVPVSFYDRRNGRFEHYPQDHLAALTDRSARDDLLKGTHSLWYALVTLWLHHALDDLDNTLAAAPPPVRIAVDAELRAEEAELRHALAEFLEGDSASEADNPRYWDFESPLVVFDGRADPLHLETRESLDHLEKYLTYEQRKKSISDLRLLATAYAQYAGEVAELEVENFRIFNEPYESDDYFLSVNAPKPDKEYSVWSINISHWEPDDPEDEECSSATGQLILSCACSTPPTPSAIANLLNSSEEQPQRIAAWAKTPIGTSLAGTPFIVTERHSN